MTQLVTMDGLVNQIIAKASEKAHLSTRISDLEEVIHQSSEWTELQELKSQLTKTESEEQEMRDIAKQQMIDKDLKSITLLSGMTVQLNATPWALKIEDESKVWEEYWKEKVTRSIDKIKLKEDIKQGIWVEWVSIESDYKFIIKS